MLAVHADPAIPRGKIDQLFSQTIRLIDGPREVGRARWCSTVPLQGVAQILELWIDPKLRRIGHARRLFCEIVNQAGALHALEKQPLRRLWIGIGHKSQVIGRSFLTAEGFHHIATTAGLLKDEDLMIYVKSLD